MQLIFERDIPVLQGKTWRERRVLHRFAQTRDKRIAVRSGLIASLGPLLTLVLMAIYTQRPSLLWAMGLNLVVVAPLSILARVWWISPLIKDALDAPLPETM